MPKPVYRKSRVVDNFEMGFKRSKKGNLRRTYEGCTLTIFKRADGYFAWCISEDGEVNYSPVTYDTEDEALDGLACEFFADDVA